MGLVTLFTISTFLLACLADEFLLEAPKEPEKHSLYYVYTALSQPVSAPGIYEFTAMGLLDDRKIDYYNSKDQVKKPEQDWMKAKLDADYWVKGTQSRKSKEQWFKVNVNILMERMNHSKSGIHSLMWRHGCEAVETQGNGNVSLQFVKGVDEYSYDGSDFLSFDDDSMQWVAPVNAALQTKRKWDDVPILNQYTKGYLEKECVEWLDKFQKYGDEEIAESLTHRPPKVHLFARNGRPHGRYLLTCLATGFYPKDIKISILKNDWPEKEGHERDVLPNGDGTHQIRVTIIAEKVEINMHRCKVEHRTLDKPIIAEWDKVGVLPPEDVKSFPTGAVVGGAIAAVLGILAVLVFVAKKYERLCFAPPPPPDPPVPEGQRDGEGAPMIPVVANQDGGPPGEEEPFLENVKVEDDQKGTERKDSDGGDSGKGGSPPGSVTGQLQEANGNHASASRETLEAAVNGDENQQGEGTSSNGSSDGSTENIQEANGNHASASRETLEAAVNGDENQQGTGSDTDDTGKGTSSNGSSDGSTENIQA